MPSVNPRALQMTVLVETSSISTETADNGRKSNEIKALSNLPNSNGAKSPAYPRLKRHRRYYMPDGNIVIQVENTLFRLKLSVLHEHSPVLRDIVPPIKTGSLPIIGYNDRRPLILHEVSERAFARLLPILFPLEPHSPKRPCTVQELLSVLKLATGFQMQSAIDSLTMQLHQLDIDPIRKIAIWDEYHLDPDLLLSSFATLCQRSEPLTLAMTMSLGIRNFTKVAASRDIYRQRVGCRGCRTSLSVEESQRIADEIVGVIFRGKRPPMTEKPML